jgi:guanylate kinase
MDTPLKRRGLMFVLSSPSGAGKTTISRKMLERDLEIQLSVSVTTRPMRPGEVDGKDYHFVSQERFAEMAANHELLEYATVFENKYGTPRYYVEEQLSKGTDILFDIDWQGTRQLAQKARADLVSVFILPPSMRELERRLTTRAQDPQSVIKKRMTKAASEISHWEEYDYVLINNDLEQSLNNVISILQAERLKRVRQVGLQQMVNRLVEGG